MDDDDYFDDDNNTNNYTHLFIVVVHLMVVLGFLRARKSSFVEELESARVPEDVGSVHRLFEKRRFRNSNV